MPLKLRPRTLSMMDRISYPGYNCWKLYRLVLIVFFSCCLFIGMSCKTAVESCIYDPVNSNVRNFPILRHHKVTGLNVANGMFTGLLEFTPPEYNAEDSSRLY